MAKPLCNCLLEAHAREAGPAFSARFEAVPLPFKTVLYSPGERPRYIHLLTSGLASLLTVLAEGAEVEVAMFGRESFSEAVYLLGPEVVTRTAIMQVAGTGLRMRFSEFQKAFHDDEVLHRLVLRNLQYQNLMATQLVACNGKHDVEQRLARWLLMVCDRIEASTLPLTQEFLAQMVGTRRSTVTLAAGALQRSGIIEYSRGLIKITDHNRLFDTACECYDIVRGLGARLYAH